MQHRGMKTWLSVLAALTLILWAGWALAAMPKNVILMISDGQGFNTVTATDFWTGAPAVYESFPVKYGMSTFPAGDSGPPPIPSSGYDPGKAWTDFNYVKIGATDSAAAATAMATGVKICGGGLNIDTAGNQLKTITEYAWGLGKASGVVTTVPMSHATPAGMFAHNASRDNYAAIANEMLGASSPLSVIMGAGNPNYDNNGQTVGTPQDAKYVGGDTTWNQLTAGAHPQGWSLIQTKTDFETLAATPTPTVDKVVGIFQTYDTAQCYRGDKTVKGADSKNPSGVAFNANVPSLATMTQAALNVLNKDADGFFLMVEGGAVDWANHLNKLDRMIEEQIDFNGSVQAAVEWINTHSSWSETLLIVTADHECGHLWGAIGSFTPLGDNGAGHLPVAAFNSGGHTNALVPLYAKGAGSELVAGYADQKDPGLILYYGCGNDKYVDNTEVFQVMNGNPAPIPGAVWLLGSGLVGLGVFHHNRRAGLTSSSVGCVQRTNSSGGAGGSLVLR